MPPEICQSESGSLANATAGVLDFGPIAQLHALVTKFKEAAAIREKWTVLIGIRKKSEMATVSSLAKKDAARRPDRTSKSAKTKARETKVVGTFSPATVLVVDDDPSVLRSLKRLVSASGFQVKTFGRPSELLASETPRKNACMVVDIDMPEMNGIEMCEILKCSGRGLPAILITGRTDARTRTLAAQSDAVAVLYKPFDEEPLLDAIGRALALSTTDRSDV